MREFVKFRLLFVFASGTLAVLGSKRDASTSVTKNIQITIVLKNHYKTLGISYKASLTEIKKAYRIMAMKYHPDRNITDKSMHFIFLNISEAYEILSDDNKRRKYDMQLQAYLKINFSYEENTNSYSNNDNGKRNDKFTIDELLKKIEHQKRIVSSILDRRFYPR